MSSPEQLLADAVARHDVARRAMARAGDERARAIAHARHAGMSLGAIAKRLGMARPTVLELARRGEALGVPETGGAIPPSRLGVDKVGSICLDAEVTPDSIINGVATFTVHVDPTCRRLGCAAVAVERGLCAEHARY